MRDKQKERQEQREAYAANKNNIKERKKAYYKTNKATISDYQKRWAKANPDKVRDKVRKYQKNNRTKVRAASRRYYEDNKGQILSAKKTGNTLHRPLVRQLKNKVKAHYGCMNPQCPLLNDVPPYCFDFHHLGKKAFNLGNSSRTIRALCQEINKCTVLCAICHRMVTWGGLDDSHFPLCKVDDEGNII